MFGRGDDWGCRASTTTLRIRGDRRDLVARGERWSLVGLNPCHFGACAHDDRAAIFAHTAKPANALRFAGCAASQVPQRVVLLQGRPDTVQSTGSSSRWQGSAQAGARKRCPYAVVARQRARRINGGAGREGPMLVAGT